MDSAYYSSSMPVTGEVITGETQASGSRGCLWALSAVILVTLCCCCCAIAATVITASTIIFPLFNSLFGGIFQIY